jgi:short-subunit dehydrogenase
MPRMLSRGNGQIVNLASAAGRLASLPGEGTGVTVTTVLPNLANTRLASGMHAARGMKKLDPAEIADAIADGLRRRRAEVYVPATFGTDQVAQDFDHARRAAYQDAAGRPLQ